LKKDVNQSAIKSKVMLIALCSIVLVFLLMVVSIVEIKKCYDYNKLLDRQEQQITDLNNAKDYYEDQLDHNNPYTDDDKVFEEE